MRFVVRAFGRRAQAAALAVVALSLAAPACGPVPLTQVELGQPLSTGRPAYDALFKDVHAAHEETEKAEPRVAAARAGLRSALGLGEGASAEETLTAARAKAAKLKEGGVLLHLQITPEVKVVSAVGKKDGFGAEDEGVLKALEASVKGSLGVSKELSALVDRAAELEKKRATLEQEVPSAFAAETGARRRELQRELEAAKRLLAEAREVGAQQAALSSKFVLDLAIAVETGAAAAAAQAEPGKKKRPGARAPGRQPGRGAPPAGRPPAPAPSPKPAGGDDFEP